MNVKLSIQIGKDKYDYKTCDSEIYVECETSAQLRGINFTNCIPVLVEDALKKFQQAVSPDAQPDKTENQNITTEKDIF